MQRLVGISIVLFVSAALASAAVFAMCHAPPEGEGEHQPAYITVKPEDGSGRIGTFRRVDLLIAFYRSELHDHWLTLLRSYHEIAKGLGDEKLVEGIEGAGWGSQEVAHKQLAGEAPLDNIFLCIDEKLPEVAAATGVYMIVEEGKEPDTGEEGVDITEHLTGLFKTSPKWKDRK
ncbi:MAG: hypothetical protein ACYTG7_06840 [Planctomycetota bacterium]|jgi:hypothetical protein